MTSLTDLNLVLLPAPERPSARGLLMLTLSNTRQPYLRLSRAVLQALPPKGRAAVQVLMSDRYLAVRTCPVTNTHARTMTRDGEVWASDLIDLLAVNQGDRLRMVGTIVDGYCMAEIPAELRARVRTKIGGSA